MVFLPRTDLGAQERCRTIVETEILRFGYYHLWLAPGAGRHLGDRREGQRHPARDRADHDRPRRGRLDEREFERELYIIRRRIEKAALAANITDFYICSLSLPLDRSTRACSWPSSSTAFYPDLRDERFVSRFAIFHQRYSTNTFPDWRLAQPFRMLAHNGEINTLKGNINWMKSHEIRMARAERFGERSTTSSR